MVLTEDENEVRGVLPAVLTPENNLGNDLEKWHHRLKNTLDRLPVEMLKLLCSGEGLL